MIKTCRIKQKKSASAKYLVKVWIIMQLFETILKVETILFLLCQYGVRSVDWCGGKKVI